MPITERVGHMALRVPDLDEAVDFHTHVLGLVETERNGGTSYLTCNERHHELVLIQQEGDARGYEHIGLEVADAEALERARSGIAAAGGELIGPTYDGEPGIDRAALVRGPGGHVYKFFCGMEGGQSLPEGDRVVKFEHFSVKARGLGGTERFIQEGLGFKFSDRMGRTASWWHCSSDHHGMAVVLAPKHELSHYAWTAPDLNAIGRICDRLWSRGQKLIWGPSRHGPGNNLFAYFHDPAGAMIEICADIAQMPPDGDYVARQWPGGLGSINQWGGTPPPRFLLTGFPIAPDAGRIPST
ncbi:MAG: VOC family protein [Solirubrobacterales bacterium]|nr:VOC family protein [Solirubrobacterales bacterium]MCB8971182.1 VOC family protein [Thermoleophilales bacterium]MCO5325963.1 VOC family protein [Solirubrobacterales bacterium]